MVSGALGKYKVEARLGGGGMAEVFVGSVVGAEGFARRVAIKRVLPGYSNNPTFAQMFVAEAQLSARLAHPNVVSVLDFDRDAEQRLFLVMELVEGRDLHALNATGLLPFPVVIHIIAEVLRGLGYAHDAQLGGAVKGVVHRDVSPHNILLSWEGDVKVSDFGLAKARDATQATATEFVKGKPAYMSPEQANGQPLDGRSDLFAVGVMLWEMLTGKRLFSAEDTRATLAAVLFGKIPHPRQFRPEVPKDLERVVMKLLEREVSARYRNAGAALNELLDCATAGAGGVALSATLCERFAREMPLGLNSPARAIPHPDKGGRRKSRRSRQLARISLITGFGVMVVVGGAVMYEVKNSGAPPAKSQSNSIAIVDDRFLASAPIDAGQPDAYESFPLAWKGAGPECAALEAKFRKLWVCKTQSVREQNGWEGLLNTWRSSVVAAPDRITIENECKVARDSLEARFPKC